MRLLAFGDHNAEFTHKHGNCTSEVLIDDFDLGSDLARPGLPESFTPPISAADLKADPLGAGLLAIGEGGLQVNDDAYRLLEKGSLRSALRLV